MTTETKTAPTSHRGPCAVPCECGGTMRGEGEIATGEPLPHYTPEPGEVLRFHWLECDKCGGVQVS